MKNGFEYYCHNYISKLKYYLIHYKDPPIHFYNWRNLNLQIPWNPSLSFINLWKLRENIPQETKSEVFDGAIISTDATQECQG